MKLPTDIRWTNRQLREAGISKRKLRSLMKKFEVITKMMDEMGLVVYGESGEGNLIHVSRPEHDNGAADHGAVVATVGWGFDGGAW